MAVQDFTLIAPLTEREPADVKDTRLKNIYAEVEQEGSTNDDVILYASKRPGLKASADTTSVAAGRGAYTWQGSLYMVVGDTVYKDNVALTATLDTTTGRVYIDEAADGTGLLVISDLQFLYTVNPAGTVTKLLDAQIPTAMVSGVVVLDQYCFVMDANAIIDNSEVGDVTSWIGDAITAEVKADPGVAIARYINYLAAFGEDTIDLFYDAGNATGSPLSRFDGMVSLVGCASGPSVAVCDQHIYFIARSPKGGRFIGGLRGGYEVERVSTAALDEILDKEGANIGNAYGYHLRLAGKSLYVLTLPTTAARTFVLDIDLSIWYEWTSDVSSTESYFTGVDAAELNGDTYILDEDNGKYYTLDPETYQDNTGSAEDILVEVRTRKFDNSTQQNKFMSFLQPIGDLQTTTATLNIAWSDDDYKTWSTNRSVDLSTSQSWLTRLGSYKRRAFRLQFASNHAMRLSHLEGNVVRGHYAR